MGAGGEKEKQGEVGKRGEESKRTEEGVREMGSGRGYFSDLVNILNLYCLLGFRCIVACIWVI